MGNMPYFPVFVDLSGKKTVVAGAGTAACEMIRILCMFADNITVIASGTCADAVELEDLEKEGRSLSFERRMNGRTYLMRTLS